MTHAIWQRNGLFALVRVIRPHATDTGIWLVEAVSGEHWVSESELIWRKVRWEAT